MTKPTDEWFKWYLAPAEDWRKKYGDAFEWTEQEKKLMNTWPFPQQPVVPWTKSQEQAYQQAQRAQLPEAPL